MESFKLEVAKLTGPLGADIKGWSQIHTFRPQDEDKLARRGELVAVISTSEGVSGISAVTFGREVLTRFHEEYYGKLEKSSFLALKDAIKTVQDEFSSQLGDLEIVAGVLLRDVFYVGAGGGGHVLIFRDGRLARIISGQRGGVITASGFPKEEDIILLSSSSLFRTITEGVIKAAIEVGVPSEAAEALAPVVKSSKEGGIGVVIMRFSKGEFATESLPPKVGINVDKGEDYGINVRKFRLSVPLGFLRKLFLLLPKKGVYVRNAEDYSRAHYTRTVTPLVGGILILLLVVSIVFGIKNKTESQYKRKYEDRLTRAEHELEEAISISGLNPSRARELINSSLFTVGELEKEGVKNSRLEELKNRLSREKGSILGEYTLPVEQFLDLSLQREDFKGTSFCLSEGQMGILDKDSKRIVAVALNTKKTEVVAGGDMVGEASSIACYSGRNFTIGRDGVFEIARQRIEISKDSWSQESLIYAYAGNLYVLDPKESLIWRFSAFKEGFGDKQKWFGPGVAPDLSGSISWTFDGSIWVITRAGRILKFSLGNQESFAISGLEPALESPTAIFTSEEDKYLYILEAHRKRVLVIGKDGEFKAQYLSDKIGEAISLVVSEKNGRMILLAGSKLYSIKIEHL